MRYLQLTFLSMLLFSSSIAQTEVEGEVSGNWVIDDSPFIVVGNLDIEDGEELEIDPGVEIRFNGTYYFYIHGLLTAIGTEDDSIIFTRHRDNIQWRGIRILNGDDDTEISYCLIEHSQTVGHIEDEGAKGAGIYCRGCDALISHNTIRDNQAAGYTAGVYTRDCDADIIANHICDNVAGTNGAVEVVDSQGNISFNLVERNRAQHGGGMLFYGGTPTVEYNIVRHNNSTVMNWGCGLYFAWDCRAEVRYNLVVNNQGGGVYLGAGAELDIFENNTIANNPGTCGILVYMFSSRLIMRNCIVWGHDDPIWLNDGHLTAFYSDIEDAENENINIEDGVIDEDPLFENPDEEIYYLTADSPCINAGDPDSDPDPDGSRADMGCFWFGTPFELTARPDSIDFGFVSVNVETVDTTWVFHQSEEEDAPDVALEIEIHGHDDWLVLEPTEADLPANDSLSIELSVTRPDSGEFGRRESAVVIIPNDIDRYSIEIPVTGFIVEGFGRLSGYVIDATTGDSLPDVDIRLEGIRYEIETDSSGCFAIDTIPAWTYEITVEENEYLPYHAQIEIEDGQDIEFNIELLFAACEVNPQEFTLDIRPDSSLEVEITAFNPGNGPLNLTIEKRFPDIGDHDPWDQRRTIDAAVQCGDNCLQGIEFDGENFYITGSNNREGCGKIHIFSRQGIYIDSFDQFEDSNWGMRDLAWDGSLLWGGDGASIFAFSPEGALEDLINAPLDHVRAITWDEANELLWICDTESDMIGIDQEGFARVTFRRNHEHRIFGLATFPEDPDGYTIYAFCLGGEYDTQVNKMNPETGEWMFVADLETGNDFMAGGVCITCRWDPMAWSFVGILRGSDENEDVFGIWHVASRTNWISLNTESEIVPPDSEIILPVMLDATDFDHDTDLECELIIDHNGRGDRITIPVTVQVTLSVDDKLDTRIPRSFYLSEPYPNPFNSMTCIQFNLPVTIKTRLELYDIQGRWLKTLHTGLFAKGQHHTVLYADNLSTGVYLLKLSSASESAMRKVVLIR